MRYAPSLGLDIDIDPKTSDPLLAARLAHQVRIAHAQAATVYPLDEIDGDGRRWVVDLSTNEVSLAVADGLAPVSLGDPE